MSKMLVWLAVGLCQAQTTNDDLLLRAAELHRKALATMQSAPVEAESSYRSAIELYRRAGANEPLVASSSHLGELLVELDRTAEAERLLFQTLTVAERLGTDHPRKAAVLRALGVLHWSNGESRQALRELSDAQSILDGLSERKWEAAVARLDLCELRLELKQYREAVALCRRSVTDLEALGGRAHAQTVAAMHQLGVVLLSVDPEEAMRVLERAVGAADRPSPALSGALARAHLVRGNAAGALLLNARSLQAAREGNQPGVVLVLLKDRSAIFKALGRKSESRECAREAEVLMASLRDAAPERGRTVHMRSLRNR